MDSAHELEAKGNGAHTRLQRTKAHQVRTNCGHPVNEAMNEAMHGKGASHRHRSTAMARSCWVRKPHKHPLKHYG